MTRIRLLGRVLHQLEEQVTGRTEDEFVGLLLGTDAPEGVWIERVLPCRPGSVTGSAALIDPKVVENVRRSLAGRPLKIVGVYRLAGSASEKVAELVGRTVEEGDGLVLTGQLTNRALNDLRVWSREQGGVRQRKLEVVRPVARPVAACPD